MNMEGTETEVIAGPMQIPRFAIFHWKNIKLIVISDPSLTKHMSIHAKIPKSGVWTKLYRKFFRKRVTWRNLHGQN